jgi:hypothetical protein
METRIIERYGKVTEWQVAGRTLYKYLCKWTKSICGRNYMSGKAIIVAPDMDTAITKACGIRGYKPSLIQKV